MTHEELPYAIALSLLYKSRLLQARQVIKQYGSCMEAWKQLQEPKMNEAWQRAEEETKYIEAKHIRPIYIQDEEYPFRLRECADAPIVLYTLGNKDLNQGKWLSIVGTRTASEQGKEFTRRLVRELAVLVPDIVIVSGLAYGVDIAAHRAALEAGVPTVAVLGHGLDRIYPVMHRQTAVQLLEQGALLTEYPSVTEPEGYHFVARDRLIAGLSDATVVVESKEHGGSLITAHMAMDYSREVFAVPGRPNDLCSKGCNNLIAQQKAFMLQSAEDLAREMEWLSDQKTAQAVQTELVTLFEQLTEDERALLQALREKEDGEHINNLVLNLSIPYHTVSATLMMMEIKGLVRALPGGIYRALK